ncbi:MAG TPA: glycosyl hydrolase family 18 protein [Anaerolineales bacterium]|nr:glycosyl hydrolase family 18 protein [Anaerolineales bacterium]
MRQVLAVCRLTFLLCLCACTPLASTPTITAPTSIPPVTPTSAPAFRVLAYVTEGIVVEVIPFERLTHLNYAFLIPNADGTFERLNNPWKLKKILELAHAQNVQVLISVGGWGWDAEFETLAADSAARAAFVQNLTAFVAEYNLDGADIDWEYPDPGDSARNFLALMIEMRAALPPEKLLTAAVVSYGDENGLGIPTESFAVMDFVNIMTYDGPDHGTLGQFERGLNYWLGRGLPPQKTVLGLPFYSRPNEVPYRKLVAADPAAAQSDQFDYFGAQSNYNGIPTVQTKTKIAMQRAGGIMFWTLDHDSLDETSLLLAIHQTVHGDTP